MLQEKKKRYKNVQMQIATSTSTSTIPFINNTIKKALFFLTISSTKNWSKVRCVIFRQVCVSFLTKYELF